MFWRLALAVVTAAHTLFGSRLPNCGAACQTFTDVVINNPSGSISPQYINQAVYHFEETDDGWKVERTLTLRSGRKSKITFYEHDEPDFELLWVCLSFNYAQVFMREDNTVVQRAKYQQLADQLYKLQKPPAYLSGGVLFRDTDYKFEKPKKD